MLNFAEYFYLVLAEFLIGRNINIYGYNHSLCHKHFKTSLLQIATNSAGLSRISIDVFYVFFLKYAWKYFLLN